jgi:two-component system cell cycle response regulator
MPDRVTGIDKKDFNQIGVINTLPDPEILVQEDSALLRVGKQGRTLAEILKGQEAAAFLFHSRLLKKKVVIALVEDLPPQDLEALDRFKPLILDLEEDLLEKIIELQKVNDQLQTLTLIDSLTGLYNNRFFTLQLDKEMARTRRTGLPCSLLMLDLDNFKAVNDIHGHVEGNRFLVAVAVNLRESVRSNDTVCRYGGDEFVVIMPATGLYEASRIADRLLRNVRNIADPLALGVSMSGGMAEYTTMVSWDMQEFVRAADSALYEAKRQGKNRLAAKGKAVPASVEPEMVSREEKESLFAIKNHLKQEGEGDDS